MNPVPVPLQQGYVYHQPVSLIPPERCLDGLPPRPRATSWQEARSYPSPPMSSPSSPSGQQTGRLPGHASSQGTLRIAGAPTSSSSTAAAPAPAIAQQGPNVYYQSSSHGQGLPSTTSAFNRPAAPQVLPDERTYQSAIQQSHHGSRSSLIGDIADEGAGPSSSAGGGARRTKAHVANACGNCKRAHLSCDVQRPCNRCVSTGKQDTCRDVPHKKRGRPRLREDAEFRVELSSTLARPKMGEPSTVLPPGERPVAPIRHRRESSLRVLRSQTEDLSVPTPQAGPAFARPRSNTTQSQQSIYQYSPPLPNNSTPIAFLDLDFIIMRANAAFQSLFAGLQDLKGRRFTDVARPSDLDSFQVVRNRLREEREAKEPTYLPPIIRPGQDMLYGTSERDIEEVTRGFDDQTYFWNYNLSAGPEQTLPTRVRLAKTSFYFVTVALPPLPSAPLSSPPPRVQPPPPMLYASPAPGPTLHRRPGFGDLRQQYQGLIAPQSAPPSPFYPYQTAMLPRGQTMASPSAMSYPPAQPPIQYIPPQYRSLPSPTMLHTLVQPTAGSPALAGDPRWGPRRLSQAPLPPAESMGYPLPPPSIASSSHTGRSPDRGPAPRRSLEEEESEPGGSPRKRRKTMDLNQIVHGSGA